MKQPETRERFRIFCEADIDQVGGIIADLTRRGVTAIGHELITDVATFRTREKKPAKAAKKAAKVAKVEKPKKTKRGQGKRMDPPNYEFVLSWLRGKKKFSMPNLMGYFSDKGRNPNSASPIIHRLTTEKILKGIGEGWYEVRRIPVPAKKTTAKKMMNGAAESANG